MTNIPQQYFGSYEHPFVAYARAYLEKDDQDPAFAARLNAFAKDAAKNFRIGRKWSQRWAFI